MNARKPHFTNSPAQKLTRLYKGGVEMLHNLEKERVLRGYTVATLASLLGVSVKVLKKWICCCEPIPADKLRLLYFIFDGKSADYLLKKR